MSVYQEIEQAISDAQLLEEFFRLENRLLELEGLEFINNSKTYGAAKRLLNYLWEVKDNLRAYNTGA